jgi:hypothetical protein
MGFARMDCGYERALKLSGRPSNRPGIEGLACGEHGRKTSVRDLPWRFRSEGEALTGGVAWSYRGADFDGPRVVSSSRSCRQKLQREREVLVMLRGRVCWVAGPIPATHRADASRGGQDTRSGLVLEGGSRKRRARRREVPDGARSLLGKKGRPSAGGLSRDNRNWIGR